MVSLITKNLLHGIVIDDFTQYDFHITSKYDLFSANSVIKILNLLK